MSQLIYGPFITKELAEEKGYKRYYINQPCKRGHVAPRVTKTRNCSRCDCDRKRKDPSAPLKPRSRTRTPEEIRIERRVRELTAPNFTYWARKGVFVYCYLSKKLKPYYVGIASDRTRPIAKHSTQIPKDRRLIRIMKSGLTWKEAAEWERRYIDHYGRIDIGTGCLWNMTDGGEGRYGYEVSDQTKAAISLGHRSSAETAAKKYNIPLQFYVTLDMPTRGALKNWLSRNKDQSYKDYFDDAVRAKLDAEAQTRAGETKARGAAKKNGVPEEVWLKWSRKERLRYCAWRDWKPGRSYEQYLKRHETNPRIGRKVSAAENAKRSKTMLFKSSQKMAKQYGITEEQWIGLTPKNRAALAARYRRGIRGTEPLLKDLELGTDHRAVDACKRFDIPLMWWKAATINQRNALRARFYRGVRGEEQLTNGL